MHESFLTIIDIIRVQIGDDRIARTELPPEPALGQEERQDAKVDASGERKADKRRVGDGDRNLEHAGCHPRLRSEFRPSVERIRRRQHGAGITNAMIPQDFMGPWRVVRQGTGRRAVAQNPAHASPGQRVDVVRQILPETVDAELVEGDVAVRVARDFMAGRLQLGDQVRMSQREPADDEECRFLIMRCEKLEIPPGHLRRALGVVLAIRNGESNVFHVDTEQPGAGGLTCPRALHGPIFNHVRASDRYTTRMYDHDRQPAVTRGQHRRRRRARRAGTWRTETTANLSSFRHEIPATGCRLQPSLAR